MRKLLFILIISFILPNLGLAIDGIIYTNKYQKDKNDITLIKSDKSEIIVKVNVNSYSLESVKIAGIESFIINTPDGTSLLEKGSPDLPKFTESVIIPDKSGMKIEIVSSNYIDVNNISIAPSKGDFTRNIDPSSVSYSYGDVYNSNSFFPSDIATLRDPYILRDFRGQTIVFTPFQYNPISKVLRIYTDFTIRISESNMKSVNVFDRSSVNRKIVNEYNSIYKSHFINYDSFRYTPIAEDGVMLIISHPLFLEAMEPFVAWKNQKGILTTIVDVSTIGNSANIKTYIETFYASTNLSYVLLVGDANLVPTISASSGDSDNSYGYILGSDSYPEVFVGRFSAEVVPHCNTMVDRTLNYEMNPTVSNLYGNSAGIGSSQGPGDDGEMDYEHIRNMQIDFNAFSYTASTEFFDGSQGGLDAAGNPSAASLGSEVNAGTGVIVYTGHGSSSAFVTTGFSSTNVNSLTNTSIYPFIWAVACVNGDFVNNTCFAEAWLRASSGNQPTGAIATLMSTINQSWNPPMCGQDEMVDILVESYANNIKRSFGGISLNGCMQMNDEYGSGGYSMTDTWNLFGDPSVIVRTAIPTAIVANHAPTTFIGTNQFQVNSTTENALVSLTIGSEILGTGIIIGGVSNITFPTLNTISTITVTITGFNKIPYIGTVDVVPNNGPYIIFSSYGVVDITGNNNQLADYGESISLDVNLDNVGIEMATNVMGVLSTTDTYLTLTTVNYAFGNIDSSSNIIVPSAFSLTIAGFVPDQHLSSLVLDLSDSLGNNWNSNLSLAINAPVIGLEFTGIDDSNQIANGRLDPGETVLLDLNGLNSGHAISSEAICTIFSTSPFITVIDTFVNIGQVDINNQQAFAASVFVDPLTPVGTIVDFTFTLDAGQYSSQVSITKKVGLIVEDWESNNFLSYEWDNNTSMPWTISSNSPYEGSYCTQSGSINDSQTSFLTLDIVSIVDDSVSFFKRVSCEPPGYYGIYDYLEFSIDNVSQGQWGGEIDWSMESYFLTAGTHSLKWTYFKDGSVSEGDDCAWIDFIVLPPLDLNYAPMFVFNQDTIVAESDSIFSIIVDSYDSNIGDTLEIGVVDLPLWMSFTDNGDWTAEFSGVPTISDVGIYDITTWVCDGIADTVYYSFVIKVIYTVGVIELAVDYGMDIYPNPIHTIGILSVNMDKPVKATISLINILGEEVQLLYSNMNFPVGKSNIEVNTQGLSNGIYYIRFVSDGIDLQKKILIAR